MAAGEAERIKRCKGRVFALQDEPEVPRVWLPFDDAPGLAMARDLGISVWRNMEWSQYLSFHTGHLQTRISSLSLPQMVYVLSSDIFLLAIPFPSVNIESDFLLFYDTQLMNHFNLILIFLRSYVCWLKIYGLWLNMSMPLTLSHILYTAKQRGKLVEEFCVYSYTNQAIALFERQIRTKAHYGWWSILQCGLWIAMIVFWIVGFFKSK